VIDYPRHGLTDADIDYSMPISLHTAAKKSLPSHSLASKVVLHALSSATTQLFYIVTSNFLILFDGISIDGQ